MNYDMIAFDSRLPAFRNKDSGSFTVALSGTVAAGGTTNWTGSTTFTVPVRMVRWSMSQSVVPAIAPYTVNDRVPVNVMSYGSTFSAYVGCSVVGDPSVTDIGLYVFLSSTTTGASVTLRVNNPYANTMTVFATTLTFYYTAFEAFGEL